MTWFALIAGATVIFLIGAHLFRSGRSGVVRAYAVITIALFVIYFMNLALVIGPDFLPWPKYLLLAFLPGTVILIIWAIKRDRDEVLGNPADREAAVTAAIVYGAGSYAEPGDIGGGMDAQ